MEKNDNGFNRREFIGKMLAAGIVSGAVSTSLVRRVMAMGEGGQLLEGIRKVQGTVAVNGSPAQIGSIVFPGDIITTGRASLGVFVIGKDAFLVRENTRIELAGEKSGQGKGAGSIVKNIKVEAGKVLSVFGLAGKRIETATVVAGTRGTGIYIEAEPDLTYLCLCYGSIELRAAARTDAREQFSSQYHEARYILPGQSGKTFLKAPKINHEDEELVMLEALVGREPPFVSGGKGPARTY